MAGVARTELVTEGYRAEITTRETTIHATGRSYNQRDDRAWQLSLNVPTGDLRRLAGLITDAAEAAEQMVEGG